MLCSFFLSLSLFLLLSFFLSLDKHVPCVFGSAGRDGWARPSFGQDAVPGSRGISGARLMRYGRRSQRNPCIGNDDLGRYLFSLPPPPFLLLSSFLNSASSQVLRRYFRTFFASRSNTDERNYFRVFFYDTRRPNARSAKPFFSIRTRRRCDGGFFNKRKRVPGFSVANWTSFFYCFYFLEVLI